MLKVAIQQEKLVKITSWKQGKRVVLSIVANILGFEKITEKLHIITQCKNKELYQSKNMSLLNVFKLLNISHKNQRLIGELQNTKLESITEFGQSNDSKFNQSEFIFVTSYMEVQKNDFKSRNSRDNNNSLISIINSMTNLEGQSNNKVMAEMMALCECRKGTEQCCRNNEIILAQRDIYLEALDKNNWQLFLSFIRDKSENTLEDRIWLRNRSRGYAYRNPDPNDNPEPSETEIEIKWNLCKEIIIEVLQES